jgi:hypothetical protein
MKGRQRRAILMKAHRRPFDLHQGMRRVTAAAAAEIVGSFIDVLFERLRRRAPVTEANEPSGSDVVSVKRLESTNSSRSVCPEAISSTICGSAAVPAMQALVMHQV